MDFGSLTSLALKKRNNSNTQSTSSTSSTKSYVSSTTNKRDTTNKNRAYDKLINLYAKRNLYNLLDSNNIKSKYQNYVQPNSSKNTPPKIVNNKFSSYKNKRSKIEENIKKMQTNLTSGALSRITNTRSVKKLASFENQKKYPKLYQSNVNKVKSKLETYKKGLNNSKNSYQKYSAQNGTLEDAQLNYLNKLYGVSNNVSNSMSNITSNSYEGGKKKKKVSKK